MQKIIKVKVMIFRNFFINYIYYMQIKEIIDYITVLNE